MSLVELAAAPLAPGLVGFDTVDIIAPRAGLAPLSTWAARFSFACRYLATLSAGELSGLVGAGLPVLPVTYADHFDGAEAVAYAQALKLPAGVVLWLDVEGLAATTPIPDLIAKVNAWARTVKAAGYLPGGYFADRTLLTSAELYALELVRYWCGAARIVDRFGALAEPACGWCLYQLRPGNAPFGGTRIDYDASSYDFFGRSAIAVVAAAPVAA